MGTLLNGETGGGMGRSPKGALLPLPAWVWEICEGDARNEAEANIAIEGGRGDRPLSFCFQAANDSVRGFPVENTVRDGVGVGMIMADSQGTAMGGVVLFGVFLGDLSGVALDSEPGSAVQMVIETTLYLPMDAGDRAAQGGSNSTVGGAGVIQLFNAQTVNPGEAAIFRHGKYLRFSFESALTKAL